MADLCNEFVTHKEELRDTGELHPRTFRGYYDTCATVCKVLGRRRAVTDLAPSDFAKLRKRLAKTRGPVSLRNEMQRVRSLFKFAFDQRLILTPVRFGQSFQKPKLETVRRQRESHRAAHGDRMFEAHEIRLILAALDGKAITLDRIDDETGDPVTVTLRPNPALKSMVLLGINCGFGQSDLPSLPKRAVDLDGGWIVTVHG